MSYLILGKILDRPFFEKNISFSFFGAPFIFWTQKPLFWGLYFKHSLIQATASFNPFDFFFWPIKCNKTKILDIKLHLFYSLVTTISLSGTKLNRNAFFDLPFAPKIKEIEIFLKEGVHFKHLLKKEDRRQRAAEC